MQIVTTYLFYVSLKLGVTANPLTTTHPSQAIQPYAGIAIMANAAVALCDLENDYFETLWLTLRPYEMPRQFSHILLGTVNHPHCANHWELLRHIVNNIDTVLKHHLYAGLLITEFDHFKESYLTNLIV